MGTKCDYFLDFAYSHEKTIRNLIDNFKCNTMQYNAIQYNTIQYNTIQYNTMQYNTIQYNKIQITNAIYLRNWQISDLSTHTVCLSVTLSLIYFVRFPGFSLVSVWRPAINQASSLLIGGANRDWRQRSKCYGGSRFQIC